MEEKTLIPEPFQSMSERISGKFPEAVVEHKYALNELSITIKSESLIPVLEFVKHDNDLQFDYLTDITAVDHKDREKRFDLVYQLFSIKFHHRLRIKTAIADAKGIPSATRVWSAANWLEREVYDMFGIVFEGHPDLKRILLSEGWKGYPLRKEYPLSGDDQPC